jgi:hypothetical protein
MEIVETKFDLMSKLYIVPTINNWNLKDINTLRAIEVLKDVVISNFLKTPELRETA